MERAASDFAAVYKFRFGVPVLTEDGESGSLAAIVVEGTPAVAHQIGVRLGAGPWGHTYLLPLTAISHAYTDVIRLTLPRAEVERAGAKEATTGATGGVPLTSKTRVIFNGTGLGHLVQMTIATESGLLRHLVVEQGIRNEVLVPASALAKLDARQLVITQEAMGTGHLIPYRPDTELHDEIRRAIENYGRLRVDLPGIGIRVIDGVVWLQGHVSSDMNRRLVVDQLTGIRGIAELHNELIADTDLAAAVSMALARDPRTAEEKIGVYPVVGVVRLRGNVHSAEARTAAGMITRAVPGVAQVANDLHVDPRSLVIPVLASVTNTDDVVPGGV